MAGSRDTATGEEEEASSAAEALEGVDSAAMSDERPNAPAASAAVRREVEASEGAADAAAAAFVAIFVGIDGVPVVSL